MSRRILWPLAEIKMSGPIVQALRLQSLIVF
jgi:hypothetical protein